MSTRPEPSAPGAARPAVAERRAAQLATPRITRELRTIGAMLRIACRDRHAGAKHDADGLCAECAALFAYARQRLANCPFGPEKPTCVNCQIHCYGRRQREAVREVMRYAGPRMPLRHPWLAIAHVIDGRRPAPPAPAVQRAAEALARLGEGPAAAAAAVASGPEPEPAQDGPSGSGPPAPAPRPPRP